MSFNRLLIHTSTIKNRDFDKYGRLESETERKNRPCRIVYETRRVIDVKGEEQVSFAKIFYKKDEVIAHQDLINFDDIDHAIIKIMKRYNSSYLHHLEVWIA